MRNVKDRIRHAISFELIGLLLIIPIGGLLFGIDLQEMGIVALVSATIATLWNYAYNLIFDHVLLRLKGSTRKTIKTRVLHAVLFESGLLVVLMPFIAWYLNVTWAEAFVMDVSFAIFYLIYAFLFNWGYDVVFPIPEHRIQPQSVPHH